MTTNAYSRRSWLGAAAATFGLTGKLDAAGAGMPLGVQLYTVRNIIGKAPEDTLKRIAAIGYTEVETGRDTLDALAPLLAKYKLKVVSTHAEIPLITGAWGGQKEVSMEEAIESLKRNKVEYMVFPYVMPRDRGGAEAYRKFADQLNVAGAKCRAAGIKFGYHNHAFEFEGEEGGRAIDILMDRLDPKLVFFELDVFWVSVAGHDPVEMLNKLKGRVQLVHLKDKQAGLPTLYSEQKVKPENFKEVGSGSLDFAAIIKTGRATGVKHFFVEQDQTPGDPVASLAKSYTYLRSLKTAS